MSDSATHNSEAHLQEAKEDATRTQVRDSFRERTQQQQHQSYGSNFRGGRGFGQRGGGNIGAMNSRGGFRQGMRGEGTFMREKAYGGRGGLSRGEFVQKRDPRRMGDRDHRFNQSNNQLSRRNYSQPPRANKDGVQQSNIVSVHSDRPVKFYVFLAKQLFHNQKYEEVVLQGVEMNIFNAIKAAEIITRYNYATITKIKTKSFQNSLKIGAKLMITLKKADNFEELYKQFEDNRPTKNSSDVKYHARRRCQSENGSDSQPADKPEKNSSAPEDADDEDEDHIDVEVKDEESKKVI
jgi:hypothetical protein